MTVPPSRSGRSAAPSASGSGAPHAALLIDFDNVTLGIRSDLTKELRTLLDSEIIRGKVAVQRAYADWRRYPQYIVPLSESSIDLIFAPAFGTNKKNATDIRLAVDAIELVFTRPEIGTIILLSGDSDFSSLVLKLKEYGKYVIGVGIRESASDLLIQNCDEYYSYSDLAGLTREVDTPSIQRDPWELVVEAVEQMVRNSDVMRSDRLKQVMQQLDPNFDERNAGFNRFSKFVTEAANRELIQVAKLDNGQYEVGLRDGAPSAPSEEDGAAETTPTAGRRRTGRGRRGRGRSPTDKPSESAAGSRSGRREGRPAVASTGELTLAGAFALLTAVLRGHTTPVSESALREAMRQQHGQDDPLLDPERFGRLLRQANDAEVADVRKAEGGLLEVLPPKLTGPVTTRTQAAPSAAKTSGSEAEPASGESASPKTGATPGPRGGVRFRRGSRLGVRPAGDVPLVGVVDPAPVAEAGESESTAKKKSGKKGRTRKKRSASTAPKKPDSPAKVEGAPAGSAPEGKATNTEVKKSKTRKRRSPSRKQAASKTPSDEPTAGSENPTSASTNNAKAKTKRTRKRTRKKAKPTSS